MVPRRRVARKLLVASLGIAAVAYGCKRAGPTGNLMPPPPHDAMTVPPGNLMPPPPPEDASTERDAAAPDAKADASKPKAK